MAQEKDKEKYGRACAADCDFEVFNTDMGWVASVSIDDYYYETDPYKDKQDAIDEQRGCLLAIKEQIEKYLEKSEVKKLIFHNNLCGFEAENVNDLVAELKCDNLQLKAELRALQRKCDDLERKK